MSEMLLGLRTVKYSVTDLERAKQWYTEVVGHGPYFDEPFYVGFNVGGYELGIVPDGGGPLYEGLRVGVPSAWNASKVEYVEFGKVTKEGQIAARNA
mgnify:CR=1 FL=1